jgi:hypothetical protein
MAQPLPTEPAPTDAAVTETVFLTEYERGLRAAVLGAILGVVLVALARRRTEG